MKKLLISGVLIFLTNTVQAFHIVGGEIEFVYLSAGVYRINLIQYFDLDQSRNPRPDRSVAVHVYRNGDNRLMSIHRLQNISQENVAYANRACVTAELQTLRVVYSADIRLNPRSYASNEGYYIQWERCCRNEGINNIVNSSNTGINYVLEIPPLMKHGEIFRNSSPIFFKPLNDYACVNQLYYAEFTSRDLDGDSLVYSLSTPLRSHTPLSVPIPQEKPHLNVTFNRGFSIDNVVGGSPPLRIDSNGLLTANPDREGLYVFAVKVEEYRDREKIGEVRRDFQLLVVDGCAPPNPPMVDIDIPGDPGFDPEVDTLTYIASDMNKCFDFVVSNLTPGETVSFRAEGVNFDEDFNDVFSFNDSFVNGNQLMVGICIPDCPPIRDDIFILDLIAADDACPLPQMDTLRITIQVEPPTNHVPVASPDASLTLNIGDTGSRIITGSDADGDDLEMRLFIEGIRDPMTYGFDLINVSETSGNISGEVAWDTNCMLYDFSRIQNFNVGVIINDIDQCNLPGDTIFINASVILPVNNSPLVSIATPLLAQIDLGSNLDIEVLATDADGDDITLFFQGGNFNTNFYDLNFTEMTGNSSVSSNFTWDLACNSSRFDDGQQFELLFIASDENRCQITEYDTLRYTIQVNYPENATPQFDPIERRRTIRIGEYVEIEIDAFDPNTTDLITIQFAEAISRPSLNSLELKPVTGQGRVKAILKWQPECSFLRLGENSSSLDVVLQVFDDACPEPNIDTVLLTFEIVDKTIDQEGFLPPNIFTPNGDGKNDTFSLSGNFDPNNNLPQDNCSNAFKYVVITNRTGTTVFRSEIRDFLWTGNQFPSGVYYYFIKYTNTEFKGYVHLMR